MLCGLVSPTSGYGYCLGKDFQADKELIKSRIGYMPQKFCLYESLTVEENLKFIGKLYQLKNLEGAVQREVELLHLEPYRKQLARQLSGGWKQRLSLGCSLIHSPDILFLDEPTAGLDPKARIEFWDRLHTISLERGTTILVSTHYMDEAEKCTQLGYIHKGRMLYSGKSEGIVKHSGVHSYMSNLERDDQLVLISMIEARYPMIMVTYQGSALRISSIDIQSLEDLITAFPNYRFDIARPSMEEAFMGMIP